MTNFMYACKRLTAVITTFLFLLVGHAYADQESFDRAVNEYLKGFRACSEASTLRLTNLVEANKKFDYYLTQLDLAVAIDDSILTSSERDMDRNLAYCERVQDNLKRAEATPILQHAFTYCDAAQQAYDLGQYQEARQQFEEYRRYKEDAYAITPTLDEVFVLVSQVRSCQRFEEKLADKEAQTAKQKESLDQVVNLFQQFKLECESTLAYVNRTKFGISELNTANKMLNAALGKKEQATALTDGLSYAEQNPEDEQAITLASLQESTRVCEGQVAEAIRTIVRKKRSFENSIAAQNKQLRKSLQLCQQAQELVSLNSLQDATKTYQASARLKKDATSNQVVNLVKNYPRWKVSSDYNSLLKQTKRCHETAAADIKRLEQEIAQAAEQAAKQAAAQEEAASQQEAPSETEAQEPAPETEPENASSDNTQTTAEKEDSSPLPEQTELDDLDDWEEDGSFLDEDLSQDEAEDDTDRGAGKSWTDLIQ